MKTILVIEEDLDLSYSLCQFFRNNNFYAIEAADPAIETFSIKDRDADLVVCSFESLAFARRTKHSILQQLDNITTAKVPWILLTAEPSIFDLSGKLICSEVTILRKPLEFTSILEVVQSEIDRDRKNKAFNETLSALNHQYYLDKIESPDNFRSKSKYVKLKASLKTSKMLTFLKRRCYRSADELHFK
jgi:DNA-binding response OmpR family regulator